MHDTVYVGIKLWFMFSFRNLFEWETNTTDSQTFTPIHFVCYKNQSAFLIYITGTIIHGENLPIRTVTINL